LGTLCIGQRIWKLVDDRPEQRDVQVVELLH